MTETQMLELNIELPIVDQTLCRLVREMSATDEDFWAFKKSKAHQSALYQYPAMMVPDVQRTLIQTILDLQGDRAASNLIDPFMGSGTVILEAMYQGLNVSGQDINPLALLVSKTRSGPYFVDAFKLASREVIAAARADTGLTLDVEFPGRDKWFVHEVARDLSKVRRAILQQGSVYSRRFLWVTLAEAVRLVSNSRTSTYKLHIRPQDEIAAMRFRSAIDLFAALAERNLLQMQMIRDDLVASGLLKQGHYANKTRLALVDTGRRIIPPPDGAGLYDMLVTSPPYGDNGSTVPYGQSSYLPLQWIDLMDIDRGVDPQCLVSTQEIDRRSLGGKWGRRLPEDLDGLLQKSPTLREVVDRLLSLPKDRALRVGVFFEDLDRTLVRVMASLRSNAYMLWTVGNRKVGEMEIPMDSILAELLDAHGAGRVLSLRRPIVRKRMATRNAIASTMQYETVLVFRKRPT